MSNTANEQLLEEAAFYIDYFTDTTLGKMLQHDVEKNDLEQLQQHVNDARGASFWLEYNPEPNNG